ncbi:MAG: YraN family protein [Clostridia bacterium]|nr:YraN family protein [Clostridia bacterium]
MFTEKIIDGIGKKGEDFVCDYLRNHGFIVIKQNFSNRYGEIDIIAENDDYIVFIEVKTRKSDAMVSGIDSVDSAKIRRIRILANDFMNKFFTKKPPRFDVAEVTYYNETDPDFSLNYIVSAF